MHRPLIHGMERARRGGAAARLAVCAGALVLAACTPVISPQLMDQVDRGLDFRALHADPQAARGKVVLLGGTIVQAVPRAGETEIEVVQKELLPSGEPRLSDASLGRFLVVVDRFLDPAIYRTDRDLTVAGTVQGAVVRRIGETDYRYPVVAAGELHLWRQRMPPPAPVYPYGWYPHWNWRLYHDYRYRR